MRSVIEWTDWHLTKRGWTPGTTKIGATECTMPAPPDRVCTYRYSESRAAGSPTAIRRTQMRWTVVTVEDYGELFSHFGPCPQEIHVVRFRGPADQQRSRHDPPH